MIQLAYECTEDKDNVDNHEHFNCSETVCLKCFGYTKNCEQQQQQTFGILLVMLLKILTRTRKTVTRIVILPGTLSGGTRKLGKDLIIHAKSGRYLRYISAIFLDFPQNFRLRTRNQYFFHIFLSIFTIYALLAPS